MDTTQNRSAEKTPKLRSIPGDPLCQNILPLTDWLETLGEDFDCQACDLATIAPWYRDLLQKKGYPELAAKIQALADGEPTNAEVARVLDEVKETVQDGEVEQELVLYDCMMQKYKEEEV